MAKYTIKGNSWKSQKGQRRQIFINRLLPVFCVSFALICIASGMLMKHSKENNGYAPAVESAGIAEVMQSTPKDISTEKTGSVEEIYITAEPDTDEETDSVEAIRITEETEGTEESVIDEEVYITGETQIYAEAYRVEMTGGAGKNNSAEKTDSTEDTGEEEAEAEVSSYDISNEVENTELTGKVKVNDSAAYTATLKAAEGYMPPKSISVIMGDDETEVEDVSYNSETGAIRIPAGTIKGNLTITGSAEQIQYYSVTSKINNSILYGTSANTKNGYSATIVPNAGYRLPANVSATAGNGAFTDFTYDAATGKITVGSSAMTGDLIFSGECIAAIQAEKYLITASVGHGKAEVRNDSTASAMEIVIVPNTGYECPEELIVISGSKRFTDFTYDNQSGTLTIGYGKVSKVIISGVCINKATTIKRLGEQNAIPKSFGEKSEAVQNLFVDVKKSDYFYAPVVWAIQSGITAGVDASHFAPYASVTRSEAATFFWRAAGSPEPKGNADTFVDVSNKGYNAKAIAWATEQGIITGVTDTTFCPKDVCTCGQIIASLARFAGVKDENIYDVKSTESIASAVKWAEDNKVINSVASETFDPYANCRRADAVTFLYRWTFK